MSFSSRARFSVDHQSIIARRWQRRRDGRRPSGRGDAGRDAQAVVGRAAHREPGHRGDGRPDPGDPVDVADGVLRQPAAPAGDQGVDRRAREPISPASRAAPARSVRRRRAAGRAPRRPVRPRRAAGSGPAGVPGHFCDDKVTALTANRSAMPTSSPLPGGSATSEGQRDDRHAGRLDLRPARSPPPGRARAAERPWPPVSPR